MVNRYSAIRDFLDRRDRIISDYIPTLEEDELLVCILDDLKIFESVTKRLQESNITLLNARNMFDGLISKYAVTSQHLSANAIIVHSPVFETAICKLLDGNEQLTEVEVEKLKDFKFANPEPAIQLSFAGQFFKRPRLQFYADPKYIPPTSNHVEQFFSACGLVFTTLRQSIKPENLETVMFLKFNSDLWDART